MDNAEIEKYAAMSLELGAVGAVGITIDQIFFDSRTYLKCMYGCPGGNPKTLCCSQPGRIKPWEYEQMLKRYHFGLLSNFKPKEGRIASKVTLEIEKKAFVDGYYFAFSLIDCDLCAQCLRFQGMECIDPRSMRPSMHSAGIDVFKTVRGLGFTIETLSSMDEDINSFSIVFFE